MVDEEIIMDTIRKMKESGLEDSIVVSTLQDIGLSEEQAKQYIARVSAGELPKQPEPRPVPLQRSQQPQAQSTQPQSAVQQPAMAAQPVQPFPAQSAPTATPQPIQPAVQQPAMAGNALATQAQQAQQVQQAQQAPQAAFSPQGVQLAQPQIPPQLKVHLAERSEEDAMRHAQTQAMIAEQARSLSEMQKTVQKAAKKIEKIKPIALPPGTSAGIKAIAREIESLRGDVEETRAMVSATKTLMEKILEVNRKILGRLP